ncbi:MAG: hypothetical protein ACK4NO_01890 [Glycocaulis sp.]
MAVLGPAGMQESRILAGREAASHLQGADDVEIVAVLPDERELVSVFRVLTGI